MSQLKDVIKQLEETGSVSRNWALRRFNTRLAGRINDLKKMGWKFAEPIEKDGDYIYSLIKKPSTGTLTPKPVQTPLIGLGLPSHTPYISHYNN